MSMMMACDSKKAEYFMQSLNANNAKSIAFLMVLGFIVYHGLMHYLYGTDSCTWLLSDGSFKGNKEWQPYGCMIHKYSETDTRSCLSYLAFWGNENQFAFIGDQRMSNLYKAFMNFLQSSGDSDNASIQTSMHGGNSENLEFVDYKLRLRVTYTYANEISQAMINEFTKWQNDVDPPAAMIASCTYSAFAKGNVTKEIEDAFTMNLTRLVKPIDSMTAKKSKVIWKLQDPIDTDKVINEWKNIKNEDIEKMNAAVYSILRYSNVQIWSSSKLIASGLLDEMIDGYKLGKLALKHDIQMLLNMYCNDNMNYNDGTCCSSSENITMIQTVTYAAFGVCMVVAFAMIVRRIILKLRGQMVYMPLNQTANGGNMQSVSDATSPMYALALLGMIMAYFYLCDRTNFFMKENKYYSEFSFWIPVGYMFVLGLFFTEESKFTKVLHRDQTDELKGWMQLVILIYYMTGASRILSIYMHMKVLISAYLFLSGFKHFTYTWQTGNTGIIRFLHVMFRMNFMTIILCLCMNRPYQFYFFVPLLSFWYCMIYFLLAIPPHVTSQSSENNPYQYLYVVLKFICILSIITILYMSEVFFERIFVSRPLKALFVDIDDVISQWWFRWKLDRYTMTYGMIFAAMFHTAQRYYIFDDNNHGNLFSSRISLTVTLGSIMGVFIYTCFTFICKNKQDCEEIHSYVVFIPIIGYIVLRNISGMLSTSYSTFFAWFGRISLELFICQYHIWLAADRHGVLVLLPGFPTLNVIITSFIFVCVSHEVHRLTIVLEPYVIPNDCKLALSNIFMFFLILIPIGRYDGMF
uniref:Putative conserved plasma membrane protein n=1 Tax=Corethrella appendiculata TaxID=1370023 RepID=U5EYQ3_9DIPT